MKMKKNNTHPLQSPEWGEFRKKTGVKVVRGSNFQLTIHKIPLLPFTIGYFPKGPEPTKKMIDELIEIGKKENCLFIQLEPNVPVFTSEESIPSASLRTSRPPPRWRLTTPRRCNLEMKNLGLRPSARPLFTRYTFQIDLTKTEEELLAGMHPKTRYNIRVAQKHEVKVTEDNSEKAFETYLKLTRETTQRQKFYAHTEKYHRLMWQTLKGERGKGEGESKELTAHLLLASYPPKPYPLNPIPLVAWIVFVCNGVLYYPYGASSDKHREAMASNLMMWEAIRFGKKMGCRTFDLWGALGPNPDKNDPRYGFHRFKEGYGGKLVEFVGSYDLILKPPLYKLYILTDNLRWFFLRLRPS